MLQLAADVVASISSIHGGRPITLVDGQNMISHGSSQKNVWNRVVTCLNVRTATPEPIPQKPIVVVVWPKFAWNDWFTNTPEPGTYKVLNKLTELTLGGVRGGTETTLPVYFVLLELLDNALHRERPGRESRCQYRSGDGTLYPEPANHLACEYDDVFGSEMAKNFIDRGHAVEMVSGDRGALKHQADKLQVQRWMEDSGTVFRATLVKVNAQFVRSQADQEVTLHGARGAAKAARAAADTEDEEEGEEEEGEEAAEAAEGPATAPPAAEEAAKPPTRRGNRGGVRRRRGGVKGGGNPSGR